MKRPQFRRQRSFSPVQQQITEEKHLKKKLQVELKLYESRLSSISDSQNKLEQYKETSKNEFERTIEEMNQQYNFVMANLVQIHSNRLEHLKTFINKRNKEIEGQLSKLRDLSSNGTKYKADIEKLLESPFSADYKKECKELLNDEEQLSSKCLEQDILIAPIHVVSLPRPSIHDHLFTNIENDIRGYLNEDAQVQFNRNELEEEETGKIRETLLIHVSLFTAILFPMFILFDYFQ